MIILFSNCGFAIIAFLFYLCGSNRVAEVFADFIVNNCYLIFAVLLIITFIISFYLVRKNSFKSVKVTATIGFTILDFAKVLIFYLLLVTWSIDFVCHNDVLNSIISLLVIPLDLMFISCICCSTDIYFKVKICRIRKYFKYMFSNCIGFIFNNTICHTHSFANSGKFSHNLFNNII